MRLSAVEIRIDNMIYCTNCGHPLVSEANFCPECGTRSGGAGETLHNPDYSETIENAAYAEEASPGTKGKEISGWIWILLLLTIILGIAGYYSYGITGVLSYGFGRVMALSAVILLLILIGRNKTKSFYWLVRILLLGQMLFLTYILYHRIMGQYFDFSALVMAAMWVADLRLLFNGNKK